jgi:lipoate-protein ligase A
MISAGVSAGLGRLGIEASFRPRNDIEVGGRKISGTGGVFEDDALLFQGTLLVDLDLGSMIKALRIPTEKLTAKGLTSARERVTSLKEELGSLPAMDEVKVALRQGFEEIFQVEFLDSGLTDEEAGLADGFHRQYRQMEWIDSVKEPPEEHLILRGALKQGGGLIRTAVSIDSRRKNLKYALITGDFFVNPARTVPDLEAALKNTPLAAVREAVMDFFQERRPDMLDLVPEDFCAALDGAIRKMDLVDYGIAPRDANHIFTVNGNFEEVVDSCSLLMLPYCAKLMDCRFREMDGCEQCGECSVGEAYRMAESMGLEVITIHNYEHLRETLAACRENGVKSYIGCCCEAFYVKHQPAFREVGIPAILIDIEKDTCYELSREEAAYAGQFENQTELKLGLLAQVLGVIKEARVAGM